MAWILPLPRVLFLRSHSTRGSEKPRVLPEPVRSLTIKSFLDQICLNDSYWTGKRALIPLAISNSRDFCMISGKLSKSPTARVPLV